MIDGLEYEQAVLAGMLKEPGAARRILLELQEDRFTEGITRDLYQAMQGIHSEGKPIDSLALLKRIDLVKHPGANEYVKQLLDNFFPRKGIYDLRALDDWVRFVDNMGRLRQAGNVIREYSILFEDFKNLIKKVDDPEALLAEIMSKLRLAQGQTKGGYQSMEVVAGELGRRLDANFEGKITDRIPTGWSGFDTVLAGGVPIGLVVLCGLPGMGKTQLVIQLAVEMCKAFGEGCIGIHSLEMTSWKLYQRLACTYAEVDSRQLSQGLILKGSPEALRLEYEVARLQNLPIFIDEYDGATSSYIEYHASALHEEYGPLRALIIDYAELVKAGPDEANNSEELRVSGIYRRAHSLSKQLGIPVILLSQYSRAVAFRNDKLGTNFDIRYSGAAEAAAHSIWHIYNPYQLREMHIDVTPPRDLPLVDQKAYIIVGKDKDGGSGVVQLGWEPKYTRWSDTNVVFGSKAEEDF